MLILYASIMFCAYSNTFQESSVQLSYVLEMEQLNYYLLCLTGPLHLNKYTLINSTIN